MLLTFSNEQYYAERMIELYLDIRLNDPTYVFDDSTIASIEWASEIVGIDKVNLAHQLVSMKPNSEFDDKGISDVNAINLWNEIFPSDFHVDSIDEIKSSGDEFVKLMDAKKPFGKGMDEADMIRYVTANSASSFIGIQKPKNSDFALKSMIKTLRSHAEPRIIHKPWLISNLNNTWDHLANHRNLYDVGYDQLCMTARTSSSSIKGGGSFRDYAIEHTLDEIILEALNNEIPLLIYAGTRSDRRGKYRLICSFDARFRIIDYILNHQVYKLCEGNGPLARYTTEGFNNKQMWGELVKMSNRSYGAIMICLDYEGYDTQLSMEEYLEIAKASNRRRINHYPYNELWEWYSQFMLQPKPLVTRSADGLEVLIKHYYTLASGLHGTHSHENIVGISTSIQAEREGVRLFDFWSNGDDQNSLIHSSDVEKYMHFLEQYYVISRQKSLIGHDLAVWGKLWFSQRFHPAWEIGTFRSIWEREGGEVSYVEPSKMQANYCKILQVAITLIRLGKDESIIRKWINELCSVVGIDPFRIPVKLSNISVTTSSVSVKGDPKGLESVKRELLNKTFRFQSLSHSNYFDMLLHMYVNRTFYDLNVEELEYHSEGKTFWISRGIDYSKMVPKDIPWVFKDLYSNRTYSSIDQFNRDVLQSTKSFDGPCPLDFKYNDMYSLAIAINLRNHYVWHKMNK